MHVVEHASGNTYHQDLEVAPRLVLDAAGHIDDDVLAQLDFAVVELHAALAIENVVDLIGPLVEMELGVGYFQVMDFCRRAVLLLDEWPDLAAGFRPGRYISRVA